MPGTQPSAPGGGRGCLTGATRQTRSVEAARGASRLWVWPERSNPVGAALVDRDPEGTVPPRRDIERSLFGLCSLLGSRYGQAKASLLTAREDSLSPPTSPRRRRAQSRRRRVPAAWPCARTGRWQPGPVPISVIWRIPPTNIPMGSHRARECGSHPTPELLGADGVGPRTGQPKSRFRRSVCSLHLAAAARSLSLARRGGLTAYSAWVAVAARAPNVRTSPIGQARGPRRLGSGRGAGGRSAGWWRKRLAGEVTGGGLGVCAQAGSIC